MSGNYSTKISTSVYVLKENALNKSNDNDSLTKQVGIIFSRKNRYFIFSFFLLITIIINIDNGCITASIPNLREDKSFDEGISFFSVGLIGSMSFLGNIMGNKFKSITISMT